MLVTLDKTDGYSPTTRYDDYPLSPTEFHWESQNTTTPSSKTGRRYTSGSSSVFLFVRDRKKDDRGLTTPYVFLGHAREQGAKGERPMRIVWRLERAMPGEWFERVKLAAG